MEEFMIFPIYIKGPIRVYEGDTSNSIQLLFYSVVDGDRVYTDLSGVVTTGKLRPNIGSDISYDLIIDETNNGVGQIEVTFPAYGESGVFDIQIEDELGQVTTIAKGSVLYEKEVAE